MGIKFNELKPETQERLKRDNPDVFRQMEARVSKPTTAPSLVGQRKKLKACKGCVVVISLVVYSHRELDGDNLVAACKPLRDGIAETVGLDDADPRIKWQYGQVKTDGTQGVVVVIEKL